MVITQTSISLDNRYLSRYLEKNVVDFRAFQIFGFSFIILEQISYMLNIVIQCSLNEKCSIMFKWPAYGNSYYNIGYKYLAITAGNMLSYHHTCWICWCTDSMYLFADYIRCGKQWTSIWNNSLYEFKRNVFYGTIFLWLILVIRLFCLVSLTLTCSHGT